MIKTIISALRSLILMMSIGNSRIQHAEDFGIALEKEIGRRVIWPLTYGQRVERWTKLFGIVVGVEPTPATQQTVINEVTAIMKGE